MLKKILLAGCCLAVVSSVALGAQAAPSPDGTALTKVAAAGDPPPPPPPPMPRAPPSDRWISTTAIRAMQTKMFTTSRMVARRDKA